MMKISSLLSLMLLASLGFSAAAQDQPARRTAFPYSNRFTLGSGFTRALLGGFNLQAEYTTSRIVFDYSHAP